MGTKVFQLKLPTAYTHQQLEKHIRAKLGTDDYTFQLEKKSLDARNKKKIHWQLSVIVSSNAIQGDEFTAPPSLQIPYRKRNEKVVVVGSGPAGFFSAMVFQRAGFHVTILERGSEVITRSQAIENLERNGIFSPSNNYAFGEGGAGTFSDGKLTSRSKHISVERDFILREYVKAGAPDEIVYVAHPHVGTDNLKRMAVNMRQDFIAAGGQFLFETQLTGLYQKGGEVTGVLTNRGDFACDYLVLAIGHSAYDTYRMLIANGVLFRTKNFAIGHRIEHPQGLINKAQWGVEKLPGVKAAEYRLTARSQDGLPVFTFCMCPGGMVVPAAAFAGRSVVNGMSYYMRDGEFANAACVVGVHPDMLVKPQASALEVLDWMDHLEAQFYQFKHNYTLPAQKAHDYIKSMVSGKLSASSYPLGSASAALHDMLPSTVVRALSDGLRQFSQKLHGFDTGTLMGFESKTSAPIQVVRDEHGLCEGFKNLYCVGEGSGYAGGIISSAADGVKCAMGILIGK